MNATIVRGTEWLNRKSGRKVWVRSVVLGFVTYQFMDNDRIAPEMERERFLTNFELVAA